jgi:hypothetical protein
MLSANDRNLWASNGRCRRLADIVDRDGGRHSFEGRLPSRRSFSPSILISSARERLCSGKQNLHRPIAPKSRFTLTAQKKSVQLFVSAPAHGGTTALGENILPPYKWIEAPTAQMSRFLCAPRSLP